MPFKKGESGNPEGKPKGLKNKVSEASKQLFLAVMSGEVEHIQDELALLREQSSEKYLKALSSLFPYFMPKQIEQDVTFIEPSTKPSWFDEVLENEEHEEPNPLTHG